MKFKIKNTILLASCAVFASATTGCLEEAFPVNGTFTEGQVAGADKSALAGAMTSYFFTLGSNAWDLGYATFMIWRDAMTADQPVNDAAWDYYNYYNSQVSLGNTYNSGIWWDRGYYHISCANRTLAICDTDPKSNDAYYRGYAYVLRAMLYFDLARSFEYKRTNVEALDNMADQRQIWGLTVPIITETTTEQESRKTPRAPFYEMYRFVNSDLTQAETYLSDHHTTATIDLPTLGVAYGLKARFWLELATRFENSPADLAMQIENEQNPDLDAYPKLEITTANDCYRKAADYARKAISEGYSPTTKAQWFNKTTGFNTPVQSWMWAMVISTDNTLAKDQTWKSWVSYHAPEALYGMSEAGEYKAYRLIDARLYKQIDKNDWRRDTWIDPAFASMEDSDEKKEEFDKRFAQITAYNYDEFIKFNAYAGFKYRPGSGNMNVSQIGNAVSIPLMRVEEMYLIEAEALAHCNES